MGMDERRKLIKYRYIHILAAVFLILGMGVQFVVSYRRAAQGVEKRMELEMQVAQEKLRFELYDAYDAEKDLKAFLTEDMKEAEEWLEETHVIMKYFPNFYTCFVAYPPYQFSDTGKWCGLTSYRSGDSILTVTFGDEHHDYFLREWYQGALKSGELGYWTQPYNDEDFDEPIFTYSDDLRDEEGNLVCMIGFDFSVRWLQQLLEQYKPFEEAAFVLYSSGGEWLAGSEPIVFDRRWVISRKTLDPMGIDLVMATPRTYILESIWPGIVVPLVVFVLGIVIVALFIRRLMRDEKENARLGTELRVASEIQQSMLPHGEVKDERLKVKGFLKPAREVGGDIYDYFMRDEKFLFCIGDVSGKGASSALLMAVTHSLFRSASAHETNPALIMQAVNEALCEGNEKNMFVTLFIGVLDLPTGQLRYCNAGHERPIRIQNTEYRVQTLDCEANLPVGVFEDTRYTIQETSLASGDMLFLYTDGLTEAKNNAREQFGMTRVEEVISHQPSAFSCQQMIEGMTEAVRAFVGDAEQSDDLTMLAIRYTTEHFESQVSEELRLTNQVDEVARLGTFVKAVLEKIGVEKSLARQLRLAIEEAVVNVIDYAYPAGTEGTIDVLMQSDGKKLRVQIADSGVPFDPTSKEKTDITLSAEDRQIGGLGILLVRELMDSINYERTKGRNVLTLMKALNC